MIWSAASVRDLHDVVDYIHGESARGTVIIRRRFLDTVQRIGQMLYSGRTGRVEGTREAVVPLAPYIVVHQVSSQAVEILGIWHGARQWPESF